MYPCLPSCSWSTRYDQSPYAAFQNHRNGRPRRPSRNPSPTKGSEPCYPDSNQNGYTVCEFRDIQGVDGRSGWGWKIFIDGLGTGVTATGGRYAHGRRQQQSLADPLNAPPGPGRYRNAGHVVYAIVKEEGVAALHRSVTLIALRQATNRGTPGQASLQL
ncbi:hypothetical protein AX14_013488 [Amanita brunnescens Koide BX004]|nr:hypothetical protein AX14_013488 [Amanita brunnescens Koide BX004]